MVPPTKTDRVIFVVMLLSVMTFLGLLVFAVISVPATLASNDNSSQVARGNDLAACRSQANADVTDKRTDLDLALAHSASLQDQFLIQIGGPRDPKAYVALFAKIADAQHRLDTTAAALKASNAAYQVAVDLSAADPDQFLRNCQEKP